MSTKNEAQLSSVITLSQTNSNQLNIDADTMHQVSKHKKNGNESRGFFKYICACFQQKKRDKSPLPNQEPQKWLLPSISPEKTNRKTLVIDLDQTLVNSSFSPWEQSDITIPLEINGMNYKMYVLKRPGLDKFLKEMSKFYEIVIFTASVAQYGNPLLDILDHKKLIDYRLFRESCIIHQDQYVKDLSLLGRELSKVVIVDVSDLLQNSPISYKLQPENAVPVSS